MKLKFKIRWNFRKTNFVTKFLNVNSKRLSQGWHSIMSWCIIYGRETYKEAKEKKIEEIIILNLSNLLKQYVSIQA